MTRLSALLGRPIDPDVAVTALTADSRAVAPGALFAAFAGAKADGAAYVDQAVEKGAVAVLAADGATLPPLPAGVACVRAPVPRRLYAQIAARFFGPPPDVMAAVTGTNGKTSTVTFAAQIWRALGACAGSLGTVGAVGPGYAKALAHTTPEPVALHQTLAEMRAAGLTHVAMEASSHALDQSRVDGLAFDVAAFTNITQDHLDYHPTFEDYFAAKARLFTDRLRGGGVLVVNADGAGADRVAALAAGQKRRLLTTGRGGDTVRLERAEPTAAGLSLTVSLGGPARTVSLPVIGAFQAENALVAVGLVAATGYDLDAAFGALGGVCGPPGRMQLVARAGGGAAIVDYAHTPAAIEAAIAAARPHVSGKLIALIGAGGDRDAAKRAPMGAAGASADLLIVTDDNPRSEDPAVIRNAVLQGAPGAVEIADRGEAINYGAAQLSDGDVFLIMGK
ncbi:MAG: UDP-N-acetylmuramoyl-L-alanyl-D-glutamate--2,6-diaminopimelate ligase, partial [Pseudomonadota bacterium]